MPGRDGFELIKHLHAVAAGIRIFAILGQVVLAEADYLRMARTFGATCTLRKPFRIAELLNAVEVVGDRFARDSTIPS